MPRRNKHETITIRHEKESRKLRDFIEKSSRTWLRPPYFVPSQILVFFFLGMILFFGYTSTRIAAIKKVGLRTQEVWMDGNMFIMVVAIFFIPVSIWYCFFGWKWQANKEKKEVRKMIKSVLKKVIKEDQESKETVQKVVKQLKMEMNLPALAESSSDSKPKAHDNEKDKT